MDITRFQSRTNVHMPSDLKRYFEVVNGSAGSYCDGLIRFWSLNEVISVKDAILQSPPTAAVIQSAYRQPPADADNFFVLADYLSEMQLYAIRLSNAEPGYNPVIVLDGSEPQIVADSFSHFVELFITSPESLRLVTD